MALKIETFSNIKGGNCVFKALGHPLVTAPARQLIDALAANGPVALYDPTGLANALAEFYDLSRLDIQGVYVQRVEDLGARLLGRAAQPVTRLPQSTARSVFVVSFDAARIIDQIRHLLPPDVQVRSLDEMRLPADMLTNPRRYLDPLNFATNFALLRDAAGQHTRVTSCNYWHGWGTSDSAIWLCLFDAQGQVLAQWREALPAAPASIVIDSAEVRRRFNLGEFTGSLFMHVLHIAGHDVVKYALDTYGDAPTVLSCTHDANAWPSDLYAGVPAPRDDETVLLWIQNSHPVAIPSGGIGLNRMGSSDIRWLDETIAPFATRALDVATLLPELRWPEQIEVQAGKYFVRPRYEVLRRDGRSRIAHANVERGDLKDDPRLAELGGLMGKGYLLPAPVLPVSEWRSIALPTPMATCQQELPIAARLYDADGTEVATHRFGRLARDHNAALDINAWLVRSQCSLPSGYGHVELLYDFSAGKSADGWLHGLFRYEHNKSGHVAETSFGAHMFNMVITYRDEPQSYAGSPPGLSTRLFLRLGDAPLDTLCHLIYPASAAWHPQSATQLILHDRDGTEIARRDLAIPCSGSRFWRYSELFDAPTRSRAGDRAYIVIRDVTCRLFGYHGLMHGDSAFCLDHMFGF